MKHTFLFIGTHNGLIQDAFTEFGVSENKFWKNANYYRFTKAVVS